MNILLTNDDGYTSSGLVLLARKLSDNGHSVYVVAPDSQRSAFSHSVNLHKELTIRRLQDYGGAKIAYTCSGTPADCVKFAICNLKVSFDLVVSGPNNGENYGYAVVYSGTVAAAEEAVMYGIKAIALSRLSWQPDGGLFDATVDYLTDNLDDLYAHCGRDYVLSVNVPSLPANEIKGVRVCPLSSARLFKDKFVQIDGDVWKIIGDRQQVEETGTDLYYSESGYVTVTPVSVERCNTDKLELLKGLEK